MEQGVFSTGSSRGVFISTLLVSFALLFFLQIPPVHSQSDFSITSIPSTVGPLTAASTSFSTIVVMSTGFSGTVTLSSSTNNTAISATLNVTSVTVSSGSSKFANLTITPHFPGAYTVNVTGTSGPLSHLVQINVTVVGEICLVDPSFAPSPPLDPCPSSPYVFNGPFVTSPAPEQIRIGVYIWRSGALNAFDITLLAMHTVVRAAAIDLTGSVLPGGPLIFQECLGGVPIDGSPCSSTDSADTLHLAATGGFGQISPSPITGLLFTAIYNITGSTGSGGAPLGFQTGCGTSSTPGLCVTVANGTTSEVTELVQNGASLNNNSSTPYVLVSATPSGFVETGSTFSGVSTVTASGANGWPGPSSDIVKFSYQKTVGLNVSVTGNNPCLTHGASCSITMSLNTSIGGVQSVTVFANYVAKNPISGRTSTLDATVTITVSGPDFLISAHPSTVYFAPDSTGSSTLSLSAINGFTGRVNLADSVFPNAGLVVSFTPTTIDGGAGTSILTFSSTTLGFYNVSITGSSGSLSHTLIVYVTVTSAPIPDFNISVSPLSVSFATGSSASSTVAVKSLEGFSGPISLSTTILPSTGLTATLSPTVILTANTVVSATMSFTSSALGTYSVVVTGMDGGNSHSATLTVTVNKSDFTLSVSSSSLGPITAGTTDRSIAVTVSVVNGFSNNILLATSVSPGTGLTAVLSPSSMTGSGMSKLIVSASASGSYSVNITGTSGPIIHWTLVNVMISNTTPAGAPPLGGPPFEIYAAAAAVAFVALLSLFLILRRRKIRA